MRNFLKLTEVVLSKMSHPFMPKQHLGRQIVGRSSDPEEVVGFALLQVKEIDVVALGGRESMAVNLKPDSISGTFSTISPESD